MDMRYILFSLVSLVFWGSSQGRHFERRYQAARNRNSIVFPVEEGIKCVTDLGWPGACVDVRECRSAMRIIVAGNHPIRCGWSDQFAPKVCCHPDQVSSKPRQPDVVYPDTYQNTVDSEQEERRVSWRPYVGNSGRRRGAASRRAENGRT